MPNIESKSVAESIGKAEARVNKNVTDIALEQKAKIAMAEQTVRDAMRAPNWKDIKERYMKDRSMNGQDPEAILATAKMHFDRVQAAEDESAGEQLRALVAMTIGQLNELKQDLGYSVTQEAVSTRQYGEVISQMTGADRTITTTPTLSENMTTIENLLGVSPREKLETCTLEVASALDDLKQPSKANAFLAAKVDYASLTGGLKLEEALPNLDTAFKDGLLELKQKSLDPTATRREAMALVEKQIKGLQGLWKIITMHVREAIVPEDQSQERSVENHETSAEALLSDEEMAEILQFFCEDMRGEKSNEVAKPITSLSEGLEATMKVIPAYKYYYKKMTGNEPEIGVNGASLMGGGQAVLDTLIEVESAGEFVGTVIGKKTGLLQPTAASKAAENWGRKLLATGQKWMDKTTVTNLKQMLIYGWNNSTPAEKSYMVSKIAATLWSGDLVYGTALDAMKVEKLGVLGAKLSRVANSSTIRKMATIAETVANTCPSLIKFGFTSERITTGLKNAGKEALNIWDHYVLHGVHIADEASKGPEVYKLTVGQYDEKKDQIEKNKSKNSFAAKEMLEIQKDLNIALKNAAQLQLDTITVKSFLMIKTEIEKRLNPT